MDGLDPRLRKKSFPHVHYQHHDYHHRHRHGPSAQGARQEPKAAKYRDCGGDHDDADGVSKQGYDSLLPTTRALHMAPRPWLGKQQATPGLDGLDSTPPPSTLHTGNVSPFRHRIGPRPRQTASFAPPRPTNPSRVHPSSRHHTLHCPSLKANRPPAPLLQLTPQLHCFPYSLNIAASTLVSCVCISCTPHL